MALGVGAGLVALVALVVALATSSGSATTSTTTVETTTETTVTTTETAESPPEEMTPSGSGWPGGTGWTVALASMRQLSGAETEKERAAENGLEADILSTDDYSSLTPGYWLVFSGVFTSRAAALQRVAEARASGFDDAYPREVVP